MESDIRVALITGAAKRLGAATAKALHANGANVVIHCHQSGDEAKALVQELNAGRANSAAYVSTELGTQAQAQLCVNEALKHWNRLDILVNNASTFFPTPLESVTEAAVDDLFKSNFTAPLFLIQAAQPHLKSALGSIVNMLDIHGIRPHPEHAVYCSAKAAQVMLTQSLAQELAPDIRVNGIAPGAILWPDTGNEQHEEKLAKIPLGRRGHPGDIANLVVYLCSEKAAYVTGEVIKVDGGRSI